MRINITKHKAPKTRQVYYRADCLDLPGSPPIGLGKTETDALAHLMWIILFSQTHGENSSNWAPFIQRGEKGQEIVVNGTPWTYPKAAIY